MRRQTMGDPLSRSNDGENDDDSGDRDACLYCHKVVLCDQSPYFRALLVALKFARRCCATLIVAVAAVGPICRGSSGAVTAPTFARLNRRRCLRARLQATVKIGDDRSMMPALRAAIAFLYTRELQLPDDAAQLSALIVDLFELAHRLLLDSLTRKVEAMIAADLIDAENACQLLILSEQYQSLFLREECFDFVLVNYESICTDDLNLLTPEQQNELERARRFRAEQLSKPHSSRGDARREVVEARAAVRSLRRGVAPTSSQ